MNQQIVWAAIQRESHYEVLVIRVWLHLESQWPAIHLNADDLSTQAERWREFDPAVARPGTLCLDRNAVGGLAISDVDGRAANSHIVYRKRSPVRGNMRGKRDLMFRSINLHAEHPAQDGTDDHRRRPDLSRRARRKRLVIVARQDFGEMAE